MQTDISSVIRGRRTIGAFRPETPPQEVVDQAIELASWAPNHKKTEPWRVYSLGPQSTKTVVDLNSSLIEKKKGPQVAESKRRAWSAVPGWLAVTSLRSSDIFLQEEDYAASCCFIQNLMLALWAEGIGTKWSTGDVTRDTGFYQIIGVNPDVERVIGLIWYGYPAVVPEQTRKPLDKILVRLP